MDKIETFRGEYGWLSNFADVEIEYKGRKYNSVEHAYISAKSDDPDWKDLCCENYPAGKLKQISKDIDILPNWDDIKLWIMEELLMKKFLQEPYKSKLIKTGNKIIEEGNYWNDDFWGIDLKTGKGENNLGRIIMGIRGLLIK